MTLLSDAPVFHSCQVGIVMVGTVGPRRRSLKTCGCLIRATTTPINTTSNAAGTLLATACHVARDP